MGGVARAIAAPVIKVVDIVTNDIAGNVLKGIGFDSLGKEITRWGEDLNQVLNVVSGQYHDDMKKVQSFQKNVEAYGYMISEKSKKYGSELDKLADKMESLIAFHEIFQMALGNRIDTKSAEFNRELAQMNAMYDQMNTILKLMIAQINQDYDFVIGLTQGPFIQRIIGSTIMIIGGLVSDFGDVLSGKADSATWKRIIIAVGLIVLIVVSIAFPPFWAATYPVIFATVMTLMIINTFMTLDGMYANGAATGAIMGALDMLFNDLLNLDDLIGSDFEKFDKNHEDYQEMVGYTQLAIGITTVALTWGANSAYEATMTEAARTVAMEVGGSTAPSQLGLQTAAPTFSETAVVGQSANSGTTSYLGGTLQIAKDGAGGSLFGVSFDTYSKIYDAFTGSLKIKDYVAANKQSKDLENKLKNDIFKLNTAIDSKLNKRMMGHYIDSAYFLQDQQEQIDRYIYGMTSENMYVDPYGTTPIANIRFNPDKDTRMMNFGYEEMFDENKMAGSKGYFNNIIYG